MPRFLIDGSNVCYENQRKESSRSGTPNMRPLITLVLALQERGIDFECIFDGPLRNRLGGFDRDIYDRLLQNDPRFWETHSEKADESILVAYREGADGIIGNDQYRPELEKDAYKGVIQNADETFKPVQYPKNRISIARLNIRADYVEDGHDAVDRILGFQRERRPAVDDLSGLVRASRLPAQVLPLLKRLPPCGNVQPQPLRGRVVLVALAIDRSFSIRDRGLEEAVREGHRTFLQTAATARGNDRIFLAQSLFSTEIEELQAATELREPGARPAAVRKAVARLNEKNYRPLRETALRDALIFAVGQVAEFVLAQERAGGQAEIVARIGIITDGRDSRSKTTPEELRKAVAQLRRAHRDERPFIDRFALIGMEREEDHADDRIDFEQEGRSMGLLNAEIASTLSDTSEMQRAMRGLARLLTEGRGP